ncbi:MAG: AzlC family ABC transporter permease [Chloroflexi bacterium]|nr:AzlC family ABC transporter permease [Chloroflexota bacterium]
MNPSSPRAAWRTGALQALPIAAGYLPIAFTYGVLAQGAGLSTLNTLLMSLLVYAGASQFVAVGLLASGASPLSIVLSTLIVNLRHMLMSATLAPALKGWRWRQQGAFAFELTDETFAVHAMKVSTGALNPAESLALNLSAQAAWIAGTALGVLAGQVVGDLRALGLDFALPALFIALLALQIKGGRQFAVAIFSGGLAVALQRAGWGHWHVIGAALAGATLGSLLERWTKRRSP